MKFKSYVNNDVITVKPREEVSLLVASESPIGYRVIVNNRHWGMIYRNQLFRRIGVGDRLKGYVHASRKTTASTSACNSRESPKCAIRRKRCFR